MNGYMNKTAKPEVQAFFEDYKGKLRFEVTAPGKKAIIVAAPDANCAIVASAKYWRKRWQDWEFYTGCLVRRVS